MVYASMVNKVLLPWRSGGRGLAAGRCASVAVHKHMPGAATEVISHNSLISRARVCQLAPVPTDGHGAGRHGVGWPSSCSTRRATSRKARATQPRSVLDQRALANIT